MFNGFTYTWLANDHRGDRQTKTDKLRTGGALTSTYSGNAKYMQRNHHHMNQLKTEDALCSASSILARAEELIAYNDIANNHGGHRQTKKAKLRTGGALNSTYPGSPTQTKEPNHMNHEELGSSFSSFSSIGMHDIANDHESHRQTNEDR